MNGKRKFLLALLASISAGVLCWFGRVTSHDWVEAQVIILSLYKIANVIDKKMGGAG